MPSVLAGLKHGPILQRHSQTFSFAVLRSVLLTSALSSCCVKVFAISASAAKGVDNFSDAQRAVASVHGADQRIGIRSTTGVSGSLSITEREAAHSARSSIIADPAVPSLVRHESVRSDTGKSVDPLHNGVKAMFTKGIGQECQQAQEIKAAGKASKGTWWASVASALQRKLGRKRTAPGAGPPTTPDDAEEVTGDPCADVNSPTGPLLMREHIVATIPGDGEVDQLPKEATENTLSDNESSMAFLVTWVMGAMCVCIFMLLCGIGAQRVLADSKAKKLREMREKKREEEAEQKAEQAGSADSVSDWGNRRDSAGGSRRGSDPDF
mmetsp:Transcript_112309/g.194737  ORF Transcript_112309/g.194737 Transcript_112309/m.194737 type:complete len:325 (-) Transcript_112309:38-1012(-)